MNDHEVLEIQIDYIEQFFTRDIPIHDLSSFKIRIAVSRPWLSRPWLKDLSFSSKDLHLYGIRAHDLVMKGWKHYMSKAVTLFLENIQHLKNITPYLGIYGLEELKCLKVSNCSVMECCISMAAIHQMVAFPMLEVLHLEHLPELKAICHPEISSDVFSNLEEVTLSNLGALRQCTLLTHHTSRLKLLKVEKCQNLEYIFSVCKGREGRSENIEFPRLQELHLEDLPNLRGICKEAYIDSSPGQIDASMFQVLYDDDRTQTRQNILFQGKGIFHHLELLYLKKLSNIVALWDLPSAQSLSTMLPTLQILHVHEMDNLRYVWSKELRKGSHNFENFKEIGIHDCGSLRSIFAPVKNYTDTVKIQFANLHKLELIRLGVMNSFARTEPSIVVDFVLFPRFVKFNCLEKLYLHGLDNIEQLWDTTTLVEEFSTMLRSIDISGMKNLKHLWMNEMWKDSCDVTIRIQELTIRRCGSLVSLISTMGVDSNSLVRVQFPYLKELSLERLDEFKWLIDGEASLEFPSLKELNLRYLSKLQTLIGDPVPLQPLFDKQVRFPNLETLELMSLDRTKGLWDFGTAQEFSFFFPNLENLYIHNMRKLRYVWGMMVPCGGIHEFSSLKKIFISNCDSTESLLPPIVASSNTLQVKVKFPQLQRLDLHRLKKFKCLLQGNVDVELPALQEMYLWELLEIETLVDKLEKPGSCDPLTIPLFSEEILIPCLEHLEMSHLPKVRRVWALTTREELSLKHPNLKFLILRGMDELKHVWSCSYNEECEDENQSHNYYFPSLESLNIERCPNLESLLSLMKMITTCSYYDDQQQQQPPKMMMKISFPKLQKLYLQHLNRFRCFILDGNSDIDFQVLTEIQLYDLPLINSLVGLEKSNTNSEKGEDQSEEDNGCRPLFSFNLMDVQVGFPSLEKLQTNLKVYQIRDEDVSHTFFPKLKHLEIKNIDVKHLPRALLQNLIFLEMSNISNLKYLVSSTPTTAATALLQNLTILNMQWISNLKYLVSSTPTTAAAADGLVQEEAVFTSLSQLQKLENLGIRDCKSLEQLFPAEDLKPLPNLNYLKLSEVPQLKQVHWHLLPNLQSLDIRRSPQKTEFLFTADSLSQGSSLQLLEKIEIHQCENMQFIINQQNFNDRLDRQILFPKLKKIDLWDMLLLTSFNSSSYRVRLPSLESVKIIGCNSLASFSSGPVAGTPRLRDVDVNYRNGSGRGGEIPLNQRTWVGNSPTTVTNKKNYRKCPTDGDLNTIVQRHCN